MIDTLTVFIAPSTSATYRAVVVTTQLSLATRFTAKKLPVPSV